jgi:hypothetical protein
MLIAALLSKHALGMGGLLGIADFLQHIPMLYGLALAAAFEIPPRRTMMPGSMWAGNWPS